jgi:hypothetical protein
MMGEEGPMPRSAITMRELQKMSAGAIQALKRPTPIKSGTTTVGILYPISKTPQHLLDEFERRALEAEANTSPEERARYDRFLAEIGE